MITAKSPISKMLSSIGKGIKSFHCAVIKDNGIKMNSNSCACTDCVQTGSKIIATICQYVMHMKRWNLKSCLNTKIWCENKINPSSKWRYMQILWQKFVRKWMGTIEKKKNAIQEEINE